MKRDVLQGTDRRSGACYGDDHPKLHALCSGTFTKRESPNSSPEERTCHCPCHTPEGAHLRAVESAAGTA